MRPKTYRRVTTFLFLFLFFVFFLLYLLLRGGHVIGGGTGQTGWVRLSREMGTVRLSEERSGGFIVDALPFPLPLTLENPEFDQNMVRCQAELYNEGAVTVDVTMLVSGTNLRNSAEDNRGLCGGVYYHSGEEDPVAPHYGGFVTAPGVTTHLPDEVSMTLYVDEKNYPMKLQLKPQERMLLELFFWVDGRQVPQLVDEDAGRYSVTVKLISRAHA